MIEKSIPIIPSIRCSSTSPSVYLAIVFIKRPIEIFTVRPSSIHFVDPLPTILLRQIDMRRSRAINVSK